MGSTSIYVGSLITYAIVQIMVASVCFNNYRRLLGIKEHLLKLYLGVLLIQSLNVPLVIMGDLSTRDMTFTVASLLVDLLKIVSINIFVWYMSGGDFLKSAISIAISDIICTLLIVFPVVSIPRVILGEVETAYSFPTFQLWYLLIFLGALLLYLLLLQIAGVWMDRYARHELKHRKVFWAIELVFVLAPYLQSTPFSFVNITPLIVTALIALIALVIIIRSAMKIRSKRLQDLQQKNATIHQEQLLLDEYYAHLSQHMKNTDHFYRMIEDYTRKLDEKASDGSSVDREQTLRYTRELLDEYKHFQPIAYTNDPLVNAILFNKSEKAGLLGIDLHVRTGRLEITEQNRYNLASILSTFLDVVLSHEKATGFRGKLHLILDTQAENILIRITGQHDPCAQALPSESPDPEIDQEARAVAKQEEAQAAAKLEELLDMVSGSYQASPENDKKTDITHMILFPVS